MIEALDTTEDDNAINVRVSSLLSHPARIFFVQYERPSAHSLSI